MARPTQIRDLSKSLEVDLAVARVRMAAMKVKAGEGFGDSEIQSAELLRAFLERVYAAISPPSPPSAELVPQDNIRKALLENLASFAPQPPECDLDLAAIPATIESLGYIRAGNLTADRANTLLSLLSKLSHKPRMPDSLPDAVNFANADNA